MILKNNRNQRWEEAKIKQVEGEAFKPLTRDKRFSFDWTVEERDDREVYQIHLLDQDEKILGLMSVSDIKDEMRIHINLIELSEENVGKDKEYDRIAGCLLAFACRLSLSRGYDGFVSLVPKSLLIEHYCQKYGFRQFGRQLGILSESASRLITEYL